MPLNGYSVNPEGCAAILIQVEEDETRHAALSALREGMDSAQSACRDGSGIVAQALAEVWQDTMVLQMEAAEARIRKAVEGVRKAVSILAGADQEMSETAEASLAQLRVAMQAGPRFKDAY